MPVPADKGTETVPAKRQRRRWLTFSLRSLMLLLTLVAIGLGVKLKVRLVSKEMARGEWVAPVATEAREHGTRFQLRRSSPAPHEAPGNVSADEEVDLLQFGILELDTPEERFAALMFLVDSRQEESLPFLRALISKSRHPEMQEVLLHLISLFQEPEDIPRIARFLNSQHSGVRAAAAESIGYIYEPAYGFPMDWGGSSCVHLNTAPAINASFIVGSQFTNEEEEAAHKKKIPPKTREPLERMMLHGPTQEERTAAARALVPWPPVGYKLRLAEWGVWIDGRGKLEIARSVLDEIPPFVHRTGNPLATITRNRFEGIIAITKPIIHLTSDRPLAVDLEVAIASGRPWYAYPRPDAFTMHTDHLDSTETWAQQVETRLKVLDPQGFPLLEPLSEGYPWIHPQVRSEGAATAATAGPSAGITAVGLCWQSLIVSPEQESWMVLPDVASEKKFRWWKALRDVPSSWVVSQGETERFLYYDGPTLAKSPLQASLIPAKELTLISQNMFQDLPKTSMYLLFAKFAEDQSRQTNRDGLFIDRGQNQLRAFRFRVTAVLDRKESLNFTGQTWLTGNDVEQSLRDILRERGLTKEEAEGLVASWRKKFFESPGQRLLTFLTEAEYERMCPLEIRPTTTEQVRVGIVLTEL